jgi:hypothetical protein
VGSCRLPNGSYVLSLACGHLFNVSRDLHRLFSHLGELVCPLCHPDMERSCRDA